MTQLMRIWGFAGSKPLPYVVTCNASVKFTIEHIPLNSTNRTSAHISVSEISRTIRRRDRRRSISNCGIRR